MWNHFYKIILSVVLILFTSCATMLHEPSSSNVPVLDTSSVLSIIGVLSPKNFDVNLTVRAYKNWGIQGQLNAGLPDKEMRYSEFSVFYMREKREFYYSFTGGYGDGTAYFGTGDGESDYDVLGYSDYRKYFLMPSFGVCPANSDLHIGVSLKSAFMKYQLGRNLNSRGLTTISDLSYHNCWSFEPRFYFSALGPKSGIDILVYAGVNYFFSDMMYKQLQIPRYVLGFGLGFQIFNR